MGRELTLFELIEIAESGITAEEVHYWFEFYLGCAPKIKHNDRA